MTNNIIEIDAKIDLTNEVIATEYDKIHKMLMDRVNKFIIKDDKTVRCRARIESDWNDELRIYMEVGFFNDEENRVDFMSDFSCEFSSREKLLQINHGCCGYFSKHNKYIVARALLVADILNNIEEIEQALAEVTDEGKGNYMTAVDELNDLRYERGKILETIKNEEKEDIACSLKVGDILEYDSSVNRRYMLFPTDIDTWKITKICDKTIKISSIHCGNKQIPKDKVVSLIHSEKLLVKKEA